MPFLLNKVFFLFGFLLIFSSCKKDQEGDLENITYLPQIFELETPFGYGPMAIPVDNALTIDGIALGRRLFYEKGLSGDGTQSCASCHQQSLSFTDGLAVSVGIDGSMGTRSAPSLLDIGYTSTKFFWDGRVETLEEQAIDPIINPLEMKNTWENAENFIRSNEDYPALFRKAFGLKNTSEITRVHITKALSQFERTIINASQSKFDRVLKGEDSFTPSESTGYNMFFDADFFGKDAECAHCHNAPQMTTFEFINNGIQQQITPLNYPDNGLGALTGFANDNGKFKVPTLRNIELTAPYMHDGRFNTLEEVINHYSTGGHPSDNTDANIYALDLTDQQKVDLLNFLKTLTDTSILTDSQWSDPL